MKLFENKKILKYQWPKNFFYLKKFIDMFNFFASFYGYPILDLDENRVKKDLEDKNLNEKKVSFRKGILP